MFSYRMTKQYNFIFLRKVKVACRIPENPALVGLSDYLIEHVVRNRESSCRST